MPLVVQKLHIFRLVTFTFLAFNLSCQHGLCSVCESRGKVNWDLLSQPSILHCQHLTCHTHGLEYRSKTRWNKRAE